MVNVCKCRCIIYHSHGSYGLFSIEHYLTVKFQSFIGKYVEPWFPSVQSFWKCPPLKKEKKLIGLQSFYFAMRIKCVCFLSTRLEIYRICVSIYIYDNICNIYIYILPQLLNSIGVGCSKLPNSQLCWNFFHHPRPVPGVVPARPAKVKSSILEAFFRVKM